MIAVKLQIAKDLALPIRAVTEKMAFLGRTGSGKTYAATKIAEQMHDAGAQIVVLDPVGNWYGLRLAADGRAAGIDIPVFGGLHGDVPLESTAGAMVADLVVDRGISMICDVSQFEADTEKARFARDFATRFFFRKKAAPSAVHLFLEECQEFVPEQPEKGEEHMLHAFRRMWKLGRNFGIGGSLITQRPQEVSKKALNLTEVLCCFQLTGSHERKAVKEWIDDKGLNEDLAALLPKLSVGEARVWSPGWLKISETVKVLPKRTFDASATPEVGARLKVRDLAPIDLEQIRKDMAETIERAKADDPRELRKQIAELQKALRKPVAAPAPAKVDPAAAKAASKEALVKATLRGAAQMANQVGKEYKGIAGPVRKAMLQAIVGLRTVAADLERAVPPESLRLSAEVDLPAEVDPPAAARPAPPRIERAIRSAGDSGAKLPPGERAVLTACAQYPDGATPEQLSILTGYKRSSRNTYIQRLREKGFVETGNLITATPEGVQALGPDFEPLPTGEALQNYWLARLPDGERKILDVLIRAYPETLDRDEIDVHYKRSSRNTYIQRLSARQLVEIVGRGVRASAVLFECPNP